MLTFPSSTCPLTNFVSQCTAKYHTSGLIIFAPLFHTIQHFCFRSPIEHTLDHWFPKYIHVYNPVCLIMWLDTQHAYLTGLTLKLDCISSDGWCNRRHHQPWIQLQWWHHVTDRFWPATPKYGKLSDCLHYWWILP